MEQKKTPEADMNQRRSTGFLLGLIFVLSLFYVSLEWSSSTDGSDVKPLELDELMHESELIPMSNLETAAQLEERSRPLGGEQLRVVDDVPAEESPLDDTIGENGEVENPVEEASDDDDKPLAALDADKDNPLHFQIVEDLPQYPGGAVELMKWLTRTLRYPDSARRRHLQGKVVAVFYVEKDGAVTGLQVTQSLSLDCDREVLRVLGQMPAWKPGVQQGKPCRTKVCIPVVFKL